MYEREVDVPRLMASFRLDEPNHVVPDSIRDAASRVIERLEKDLLTPFGLRSLSREDKQYRPCYGGDPWTRDTGYHQGTVWSWLLGPFITGYLRVNDYSISANEKARQWLRDFHEHLLNAGLGQVSEIFDADPPYEPRGCIVS